MFRLISLALTTLVSYAAFATHATIEELPFSQEGRNGITSVRYRDGSRYLFASMPGEGQTRGPDESGDLTEAEREQKADGHPWMKKAKRDATGSFERFKEAVRERKALLERLPEASIDKNELRYLGELLPKISGIETESDKYSLMRRVTMIDPRRKFPLNAHSSVLTDKWFKYLSE